MTEEAREFAVKLDEWISKKYAGDIISEAVARQYFKDMLINNEVKDDNTEA